MKEENILENDERTKIERVPYHKELNHTKEFVQKRREWIEEKSGAKFSHLSCFPSGTEEFKGNTENLVGVVPVPLGVVGPLSVKGEFAEGIFYVPFATTEGALVETYQRGAIALTKSGGAKVFVNKEEFHLDPIFSFKSNEKAKEFTLWVSTNFLKIKEKAEATTSSGGLLRITPYLITGNAILDFAYSTGDAMGGNMINIATEAACNFISQELKIERPLLRSNLFAEKKASSVNLWFGCGKEVLVETTLLRKVVKRFLFTTPEIIAKAWHSWAIGSISSGMLGINAHFSNGLAALFIACGQDVGHIPNACVGVTSYEVTESGDLYVSLRLPNIIVGTVGGGTALSAQRECLEMIGCYGKGKAKKFAEIIGATLIAGEIGICAGLTTDQFLEPHKRVRVYTKEKAYQQETK